MVTSVLPNRERRHMLQFHVLPRLTYGVRIVLAILLIGGAIAAQLWGEFASVGAMLKWTLPFLLAGNLLLLIKGCDSKPTNQAKGGEWEKTTLDRFQAARDLERSVRRWDQAFADISCFWGCASLIAAAAAVAVVAAGLASNSATAYWAPVFLGDAAVLALPHWITGLRRGWRPETLGIQIEALEAAFKTIDPYEEPPCQIQPMFRMAGAKDHKTPTAARALIRFPDGPESFIGIQYQVSLNQVQGTNYPYLYAVLIAKKEHGLRGGNRIDRIKQLLPGLTIEDKREGDVDIVVIRQKTTRTSGYHTKARAIRDIARGAWEAAAKIALGRAVR
ncbi:MAG: hypothetical protein BWZ10_01320 [candidate division BRC1 bacterium ADurb.BinA364]|nr:MAG: hypothetical protein BWZ10_01320 [candidate division BRC1 bacterium ADurb.BinA364]